MGLPLRFAPDPDWGWGWHDMLAPLAALKLVPLKLAGLKLPAVASSPWGLPALFFGVFYAVTSGSFLNFLTLCVSHGVAIGAGLGCGASATYLSYRRQSAAALEEIDRRRATFDREMERERLDEQIARDRLRAEASAANGRLEAEAKAAALLVLETAQAEAYKVREQAERGSTLVQLREAEEKIIINEAAITDLKEQLAVTRRRAEHFAENLASVAIEALHDKNWGRKGDDAGNADPPPA